MEKRLDIIPSFVKLAMESQTIKINQNKKGEPNKKSRATNFLSSNDNQD